MKEAWLLDLKVKWLHGLEFQIRDLSNFGLKLLVNFNVYIDFFCSDHTSLELDHTVPAILGPTQVRFSEFVA